MMRRDSSFLEVKKGMSSILCKVFFGISHAKGILPFSLSPLFPCLIIGFKYAQDGILQPRYVVRDSKPREGG